MTFQPAVPFSGNMGWSFLDRTRAAQQAAFDKSAPIQRDTDYFKAKIPDVTTPEALVSDRRLLRVALGAFGLSEDIDAKFFIRKVLEDGSSDRDALANRLADKRYLALAEAFGFDLRPPNTQLASFAEDTVAKFRDLQFERAVGARNPDLRLALSLERELTALLGRGLSDKAAWYTVLATPPLRAVFERALSLPPTTGSIDVDQQLRIFRDRSKALIGSDTLADFGTPEGLGTLRKSFLARSEAAGAPGLSTKGAVALALLQASAGPGAVPIVRAP